MWYTFNDSTVCFRKLGKAGAWNRISVHAKVRSTRQIACEQALLWVGGGRGKEEKACNDVSGIFISASKKSMQNADWWILSLVLTSLLFACLVLTIQKWWKAEFLFYSQATRRTEWRTNNNTSTSYLQIGLNLTLLRMSPSWHSPFNCALKRGAGCRG